MKITMTLEVDEDLCKKTADVEDIHEAIRNEMSWVKDSGLRYVDHSIFKMEVGGFTEDDVFEHVNKKFDGCMPLKKEDLEDFMGFLDRKIYDAEAGFCWQSIEDGFIIWEERRKG